jgi:hypothetical protein
MHLELSWILGSHVVKLGGWAGDLVGLLTMPNIRFCCHSIRYVNYTWRSFHLISSCGCYSGTIDGRKLRKVLN